MTRKRVPGGPRQWSAGVGARHHRPQARKELQGGRRTDRQEGRRPGKERTRSLEQLRDERSKLLRLHYADKISADLFGEEEQRLSTLIDATRTEIEADQESAPPSDLLEAFEQVAQLLASLDLDQIWTVATDQERRTLLDELLDRVVVFADHLEVEVHGAPRLNVALAEVGLEPREQIGGVGGGT